MESWNWNEQNSEIERTCEIGMWQCAKEGDFCEQRDGEKRGIYFREKKMA